MKDRKTHILVFMIFLWLNLALISRKSYMDWYGSFIRQNDKATEVHKRCETRYIIKLFKSNYVSVAKLVSFVSCFYLVFSLFVER